jgi:mono/diheme cytochrome c family protein
VPDDGRRLLHPRVAKRDRRWLRLNHCLTRWGLSPVATVVALSTAACLWLAPVPSGAQEPNGKQDYEQYCAVCHGPKGKGNGVGPYSLPGTNPSDLTHLSRRNGGKFPFDEVYAVVDGRKEFPSHERLNMPFFGTNLEIEEGESLQAKARVDARITAIVRYVESLQEK